ncbi:MAG TPA: YciI family protein [Nannocystis sp.]|jgi:uncharacterized protein YciI
MAFFFARLTPLRPDFPADMTPAEGAVMQQHGAFLGEQLARGVLVAAAPVFDPGGVFGMAIFEADSLDVVQSLLASDPANAVGRYEVLPMGPTIARAR